ncbi:MAG: hypothetical protein SFV54_21425 [Bryobacteraceae bacterium]|nr:hypothetical protein [Bryobacteraceae bacterium]
MLPCPHAFYRIAPAGVHAKLLHDMAHEGSAEKARLLLDHGAEVVRRAGTTVR